MEATRYPIDLAELKKGENYDMQARGVLTTLPRHPRRRLELLVIRDEIQRMADSAGMVLSLRIKGDRIIRCMTDAEAAEYHDRHSGAAIAKLGRQVQKMRQNVDQSNLDEIQRRQHEQAVARRGLQYMAAVASSKKQAAIVGPPSGCIDQTGNSPNPFKQG